MAGSLCAHHATSFGGARLGRARTQNIQSQSQMFEGVCPAKRNYSALFEVARNSPTRPFKAVARVQIPLGPLTRKPRSEASQAGPYCIDVLVPGARMGREPLEKKGIQTLRDLVFCILVEVDHTDRA